MEMTKRGVPGVWTYGFYDGWVPNYMFFIAHAHNSIGRFYEVMGYGPENRTVHGGARRRAASGSGRIRRCRRSSGDRATTPTSSSPAILIALNHVAKNKETYLENYWIKNKNAVKKGTNGPTYGWVIPAAQKRKADAAQAVNDLRRQGLEVHTATSAFKAGSVDVEAGRLRHPRRSAVPHDRRHVLRRAELRAVQSAPVRRHRLDVPVHAQPRDQADHRQERRCRSR